MLFAAQQGVSLCVASHNQSSCVLMATILKEKSLPTKRENYWFSQLFGMADQLSLSLARQGFRVVKYLPYGPVEDLMPYLLRRVEENSGMFGCFFWDDVLFVLTM